VNKEDIFMTYMLNCKNGYLVGIQPFGNHIQTNDLYDKLCFLADQLRINEFTGFLLEGQYFINLWTSIIILEKFKPKLTDMLIGLNDKISIVDDCLDTVERYSVGFKQEKQFENYQKWILEIKSRYNI
jgi:hypothetical protein